MDKKTFTPLHPERPDLQSVDKYTRGIKIFGSPYPFLKRDVMGFTVLETVISLLVLGVISTSVLSVFHIARSTYDANIAMLDLHNSARVAIDKISKELRQSTASQIIIGSGSDEIDFAIPTNITSSPATYSSTISYYRDTNSRVIREYPAGTTVIIADNIANLQFSRSGKIVTIRMQAQRTLKQRTYTLTLNEQIRLRN